MARPSTLYRLAAIVAAAPLLLAGAPPAQLSQAIAMQRDLVSERPGSAGTLNDLGNLLVEAGEMEEAEEAYRQAIAIDPEAPEPAYNLALMLSAKGHRREARHLLKTMLAAHPDHAWAHYQLGTLHQAAGKRRLALRSYREAFRLDPSLSDPRTNPHVLDNPLTTAAMLEAFALIAHADTTQRLYVEPSRISGLLLPPLTAAPDQPEPETPMGEAETEPAPAEAPAEPPG